MVTLHINAMLKEKKKTAHSSQNNVDATDKEMALRKQGVFKVASPFQALHNFTAGSENDQIPNAVPVFGFFPPHPHQSWCIPE